MYPKLSDLINDLLGSEILLPIQTYGFFVALAFLSAAIVLWYELKRKEKEGLLKAFEKPLTIGRKPQIKDLLIPLLVGFVLGYKGASAVMDYDAFAQDPQAFLFNTRGSWLWGILIGMANAALAWYRLMRRSLPKPEEKTIVIHPYQLTGNLLVIAAFSGIVGAKLFHQFENWDAFISDPMGSLFSFYGLTFYGGLIVAAFVVIWYAGRYGIQWKHLADAVAPALILAYGVGRMGCQLSGDGDWGIVNMAPMPGWLSFLPEWVWSFDYPHNVIKTGIPIEGCQGPYCFKLAEPVFPTPIYETTMSLLIFGILMALRKTIRVPGALFAIYLVFNGTERFLIEKIRVNETYLLLGMEVTQAEIISTLLVLTGLIMLIIVYRNQKKANELPGHHS